MIWRSTSTSCFGFRRGRLLRKIPGLLVRSKFKRFLCLIFMRLLAVNWQPCLPDTQHGIFSILTSSCPGSFGQGTSRDWHLSFMVR